MGSKLLSFSTVLLVNVISLLLILSMVVYRTDLVSAQAGPKAVDDIALVPRNDQIADVEDDDDGDDEDGEPPTDNDGTDSDGYDTPPGEEDNVIVYTIRPGDTLMRIALRLGVPYSVLKAQDDTPSMIQPGQKFYYRPSDRIDSSIPLTDDDGTDSDGYDTPPPTTDFDGISTLPLTSLDGTDSDGYDTTGYYTDNDGIDTPLPGGGSSWQLHQAQLQQARQQQVDPFTDNDGTDSDGYDTTGDLTSNDGTDSDGIDTTGQLSPATPSPDTPQSPDTQSSPDSDNSAST